jgi:hypothetical protein
MEEVMDLGSYPKVILPRGLKKRVNIERAINLNNLRNHKMRGVFWNYNGFKDPKKHRFISDLTREQNLSFIAAYKMGRKGFHDSVLRNLCGGQNFIWHCKEPRGEASCCLT